MLLQVLRLGRCHLSLIRDRRHATQQVDTPISDALLAANRNEGCLRAHKLFSSPRGPQQADGCLRCSPTPSIQPPGCKHDLTIMGPVGSNSPLRLMAADHATALFDCLLHPRCISQNSVPPHVLTRKGSASTVRLHRGSLRTSAVWGLIVEKAKMGRPCRACGPCAQAATSQPVGSALGLTVPQGVVVAALIRLAPVHILQPDIS